MHLSTFPATQLEQSPPSGPVEPALHLHVEAPDSDSEAAAQSTHSVDAVAAANFPASQASHNAVPGFALKEPAAHSAHGPSSGPVLPGGHGTGTCSGSAGGGGGGLGEGHWVQSHLAFSAKRRRPAPPSASTEGGDAGATSSRPGSMLARVMVGVLPIASRLRRRAPTSLHTHAHSPFLELVLMILSGTKEPGPVGDCCSSTHLHTPL